MANESLVNTMRACRHAIHSHPETAFEEHQTAKLIAKELRKANIEVHEGIGKTGMVAVLRNGEGPSIGLRADMDALPITEANNFSHRSRVAGKMHACGHDGHSSMLLGAALYLNEHRNWNGTINFIFQPAEESYGGGKVMLEDGLFERFPCDSVFGLHNWPGLPAGTFAINHGPMMAALDTFEITVIGKGAHAAMPELGVDPLVIASQIVLALQTIVSRKISPNASAVVTVTQIHGGDAWNVIPDTAVIRGTVRCFSEKLQSYIEEQIRKVSQATAFMNDGRIEVTYTHGYPPTINHSRQADIAIRAAQAVAGEARVLSDCVPSMASEDFAFMLKVKQGAYIWMGVDGEKPSAKLHNPRYDFNDDTLEAGMLYWVRLAELFCKAT
jgi:amidohydrolase